MTAPIRIGHGNGHNKQTLVEFVRDADADSFGCNEAHLLANELDSVRRHRVTAVGEGWREDRGRAGTTRIVTSNRRENLGELTRLVSDRLPNQLRTAPDRPLVCSMYAHPLALELGYRGVAHFELHTSAGPAQLKGTDRAAPVVRETMQAFDLARHWMRAARYDRLLLVLTGDLQVTRGLQRAWSPERMIAGPLSLEVLTPGDHIDWLMVDKALKPANVWTRRLYDHTGFVADLEAA